MIEMLSDLIGRFALVIASAFTGAAFYILFVEQPARLSLGDAALLQQWKPAYKRGTAMQASLALLAAVLGGLAWWGSGSLFFAAGAVAMFAPWPYTLLLIAPTNRALTSTAPEDAGADSRRLIIRWARLHIGRAILGLVGTICFLAASMSL